MKKILIIILGLSLVGACAVTSKEKTTQEGEAEKPNILFLFADDQRFHSIGALGNEEVITPNIDNLVENGTAFTNAYIMGAMNGAVCAPSRAMLMTGRALFNIDPTGNTIDKDHTTMPKALAQDGYQTFHIGKWHNGKEAFLQSFGDGSRIFFGGMHRQYEVPTYEFQEDGIYSKDRMNRPSPKHSSELYADATVNFLNQYDSEKPFFAYVAFQAPHDPREMPQEYLDMYNDVDVPIPPNFNAEHPFDNGELDIRDEWLAGYPRSSDEVIANIKAYYAMITHLDAQIGRILESLRAKGLDDNTIVVFAGDNGLAVGQHGLMGKQNLYEHSINVPLIFTGPGIPKGKKTATLAYLSDVYPTFCDLVSGVAAPPSVEGKSLKASILGDHEVRSATFHAYKNFQRAARNKEYKIIKYNVEGRVTTQLFNLETDPFETNNLAGDSEFETQLQEMEGLLRDLMSEYNDEADLDQDGWGVPVLPAWKDKSKPEVVEYLRKLALEERKMRGF